LEAFDRAKVRNGVLALADQADVQTRERRPLRAPVSWCPEATWKLRIEDYRGLAAAREMDMDCRPFEDALAQRHRSLDAA
jgi:hypothetical protein